MIHIKYISRELQAIDPIPIEFEPANPRIFKKGAVSATCCGVFNCVCMTRTDCVEKLRNILAAHYLHFDSLTGELNAIDEIKRRFIRQFVIRTKPRKRRRFAR